MGGLLFPPGVCKNVKNVKTKCMYVYKKGHGWWEVDTGWGEAGLLFLQSNT